MQSILLIFRVEKMGKARKDISPGIEGLNEKARTEGLSGLEVEHIAKEAML
jgi:hypothetical protein